MAVASRSSSGEAIAFLAERLTTPLQIEHYLKLAFESGYKVGTKPITAGIIESVSAHSINDLEPRLIRHRTHVRCENEKYLLQNFLPSNVSNLFINK